MFCRNCGNKLREGIIYCTQCGTKIFDNNENNTDKESSTSADMGLTADVGTTTDAYTTISAGDSVEKEVPSVETNGNNKEGTEGSVSNAIVPSKQLNNNSEINKKPLFSKTFYCIVITMFAIAVIILIFSSKGAKNTNNVSKSATKEESKKEYAFQNDIDFVLDRKVFAFADTEPELYTAGINDIDKSTAYVEDWTYRKVLCDDCFENIDWTLEDYGEIGRQISFAGDSKILSQHYKIDFIIQKGATLPLAWKMYVNDECVASVETFKNNGMSVADGTIYTDVMVTQFVVLASEEFGDGTSESMASIEGDAGGVDESIILGDDRVKNKGCKDLPQLPVRSSVLNLSLDLLQKEKGYYLQGPTDFYQSMMGDELGFFDFDGVDCYNDAGASDITIYGIKDNVVLFCAIPGLTSEYTIKDVIPSDCWSIKPRIFNAQKDDYVWKLENGYLIVNVYPRDVELKDQIVNSVVYTTELGGFAFAQSTGVPYE